MNTQKFKTNIKCMGCISTVTPYLNKTVGENNWEVDLQDPNRILSVPAEESAEKVVQTVKEAGFTIEKV